MFTMFEDIITVYHSVGDSYVRNIYRNVYFKRDAGITITASGEQKRGNGVIRIPTSETIDIKNGDYVIYGTVTADWNLNALLKNYELYKVVNVTNNIRGGLKHYKIEVSL